MVETIPSLLGSTYKNIEEEKQTEILSELASSKPLVKQEQEQIKTTGEEIDKTPEQYQEEVDGILDTALSPTEPEVVEVVEEEGRELTEEEYQQQVNAILNKSSSPVANIEEVEEVEESNSIGNKIYTTLFEDPNIKSVSEQVETQEWIDTAAIVNSIPMFEDRLKNGETTIEVLRGIRGNLGDAIEPMVKAGRWTPEQGEAYLKLSKLFDYETELEGVREYTNAMWDYGYEMISDPTAQIALLVSVITGGGSLSAREAAKFAAMQASNKIIERQIAKKVGKYAAVEGAVFTSGIDAATQITETTITPEQEFSWTQNLIAASTGAVLGATFGAGLTVAGQAIARKAVRKDNNINSLDVEDINVPEDIFLPTLTDDTIEVDGQFIPKDNKALLDSIVESVGVRPLTEEEKAEILGANKITSMFELQNIVHKVIARSIIVGTPAGYLSGLVDASPTAAKLQKLLRHDVGRSLRGIRDQAGETVGETIDNITGEYYVNLSLAIEPLKDTNVDRMSEATNNRLIMALRGKKMTLDDGTPDVLINTARDEIRAILDDMHATAGALGLDVGYTPNYVPRSWSRNNIINNRRVFEEKLVKSGEANNITEAEKITDGILSIKDQVGYGAKAGFSSERTFTKILDDNEFSEFLVNDVVDIFNEYIINHGHKLGITQSLGVKNLAEFNAQYVDVIGKELKAAGRLAPDGVKQGLTVAEQNFISNMYKFTANEDLFVIQSSKIQAIKDWTAVGFQINLLPLAAISSLSEIFLPLLRSKPSQFYQGLKAAGKVAAPTVAHKAVVTYNRVIVEAGKKLTTDMFDRLVINHKLSKPEAWLELNKFNIAMDNAAAEMTSRLSGTQVESKLARKTQNAFFKVTALTDWTKFVELVSMDVGKQTVVNNLKLLAREFGIEQGSTAVSPRIKAFADSAESTVGVGTMRKAKKIRLLNELRDLNINLEEGLNWISRGALVEDEYYNKVATAGARFTKDVILHPNRKSGIKSNLTTVPGWDLVFQLMSYPIAFTNVILKQMARATVGDDATVNAARLLSVGSLMTFAAVTGNAIRTEGKSLEDEPMDIALKGIARWGGNGMMLEVANRANINIEYVGAFGVPLAFTGPLFPAIAKAVSWKQGLLSILGTNFTPFGGAIKPVFGEDTKKGYDKLLRDLDSEIWSGLGFDKDNQSRSNRGTRSNSRSNRGSGERRERREEGGLVQDVPRVAPEPDERVNPLTGQPYNLPAGKLLDDDDPLQRLGFSAGGYLASRIAKPLAKYFSKPNIPVISEIKALDSLAAKPLQSGELDAPIVLSFMNSNKSIAKKRRENVGTMDMGNTHEIMPVESPEGQAVIKEFDIEPTGNFVVVENKTLQSKGKSGVRRVPPVFYDSKEDIMLAYSSDTKPFFIKRGDDMDWRTTDDVDAYGLVLPQRKIAKENMLDEIDPELATTILDMGLLKTPAQIEYFNYAVENNLINAGELKKLIHPVTKTAKKEVHNLPTNKGNRRVTLNKFLVKSLHKLPVYRGTTSDEPTSDLLLGLTNPRQIGLFVGENPDQANTMFSTDLVLTEGWQPDKLMRTTPEKREEVFSNLSQTLVEPEGRLQKAAISEYYIDIRNPLVMTSDISLWDAEDIIPRMLNSRIPDDYAATSADVLDALKTKEYDYSNEFGTYDKDSEIAVNDYIKAYVDDDEFLIDDLAAELEMDDIDVDNIEAIVDDIMNPSESMPDETGFVQAIEEQLGRPLTSKEWDGLDSITNKTLEDEALIQYESNPEMDDYSIILAAEGTKYDVNRKFRSWLQSLKFDSIQLNNTGEASTEGAGTKSWILFDSKQIKAKNNITFDTTDPRVSKFFGGLVRSKKKEGGPVEMEGGTIEMVEAIAEPMQEQRIELVEKQQAALIPSTNKPTQVKPEKITKQPTKQQAAMVPSVNNTEEDKNMVRLDGSKKSARGYLGSVYNEVEKGYMTEVSIGVEINNKEMQIPLMVPGLTKEEINTLANMRLEGNAKNIPQSIIDKAQRHAAKRITEGKNVFYQDGEELEDTKKPKVRLDVSPYYQSTEITPSPDNAKLPALNSIEEAMLNRESSGNYQSRNEFGFSGGFQMGVGAMETLGYMKEGSWSEEKGNSEFTNPDAWTGKKGLNSLEDFLSNPNIQKQIFNENYNFNLRALRNKGIIDSSTTPENIQAYVFAAHLLGAAGSRNLQNVDAFGTKGQEYFDLGKSVFYDVQERKRQGKALGGLVDIPRPPVVAVPEAQSIANPDINKPQEVMGEEGISSLELRGKVLMSLKRKFQ